MSVTEKIQIYDGGKTNFPNRERPVVVDLEGLQGRCNTGLSINHKKRKKRALGVASVIIENDSLMLEVDFSITKGFTKDVIKQTVSTARWQVSIDTESINIELVRKGTREINGIKHKAPFYHIKQSTSQEISIVDINTTNTEQTPVRTIFSLTSGS